MRLGPGIREIDCKTVKIDVKSLRLVGQVFLLAGGASAAIGKPAKTNGFDPCGSGGVVDVAGGGAVLCGYHLHHTKQQHEMDDRQRRSVRHL
jgi:hypothetical protein